MRHLISTPDIIAGQIGNIDTFPVLFSSVAQLLGGDK